MKELTLIKELLDTITLFLDTEEKLGFLSQTEVDKIVDIEDMLQDLLSTRTKKSDSVPPSYTKTIQTFILCDDDTECDTHLAHQRNQPEL